MFKELFLTGLTLAAMYALVSAGLTLVFGILGAVNFAHGELFMLGGIFLYVTHIQFGLPYGLSLLATVIIMGIGGLLIHLGVIRRIMDRSWQVGLIATLALSIFISNGAIMIWGAIPKQVPTELSRTVVDVLGTKLSGQRVLMLLCTTVVFFALYLLINHTKIGRAMRAASQNKLACEIYGVNLGLVTAVTFVLSAGLAALAGGLIAPVYNVSPLMGSEITLKAFPAVIMGGLGSVPGALVAAVFIGLVESFGSVYISTAFKDSFAFIAMIIVLMVRPQGLFGRRALL